MADPIMELNGVSKNFSPEAEKHLFATAAN